MEFEVEIKSTEEYRIVLDDPLEKIVILQQKQEYVVRVDEEL